MITQDLSCGRVLLKYKKGTEKASETDIRRGTESAPPPINLSRGATYFFQTHSYNIHLKLTRLELIIE